MAEPLEYRARQYAHELGDERLAELLLDMADHIVALKQRLRDVSNYAASGRRYLNEQIEAVESVVPLLRGIHRCDCSGDWWLSQVYLDAHRLPTPEQMLKALTNGRPETEVSE